LIPVLLKGIIICYNDQCFVRFEVLAASVAEDSSVLGCYAMLIGNVFFCRVKQPS